MASNILFGKSTSEDLKKLDETTFLSIFEGVPQFRISFKELNCSLLDLLTEHTSVFNSKGEAKRMISSNAVSINKEKINLNFKISEKILLEKKYLIIQKGKKNYFLVIVS